MKPILKKTVILSLSVPLALSGCYTTGSVDGRATSGVENKAIQESQAVGALIGAAIGGGAGYAASRKGNNTGMATALGALAGAGIGGALGNSQGANQVRKTRLSQSEVNRLEGMVASARRYNKSIEDFNRNLRSRANTIQKSKSSSDKSRALGEAKGKLSSVSREVRNRESKAKSIPSEYSGTYGKTTKELKQEEDAMEALINQIEGIDTKVG